MTNGGPQIPVRRLKSWKEIANHLGVSRWQARRLAETEDMPVRRPMQDGADVFAFVEELERWRTARAKGAFVPVTTPEQHVMALLSQPLLWGVCAFVVLGMAGTLLWYLSAHQGVHLATLPPAVALTSYPGEEIDPGFSPDASQVVFSWRSDAFANFGVFAETVGSGHPTRLTAGSSDDVSPAWSPDGGWIAFLRRSSADSADVNLVPALGGVERKLCTVKSAFLGRSLDWSPDMRWIAASDGGSLVLISVDSGDKHPLTRPQPGMEDQGPAFAGDGHRLLFCRSRQQGPPESRIFLLRLPPDGTIGEPVPLTAPGIGKAPAYSPQWLPGDEEIIFVSSKEGRGQVWRARLQNTAIAGLTPLLLLEGDSRLSGLKASPHGHRLAFSRAAAGSEIWKVGLGSADGRPPGATERLIADTREQRYPQFSPDENLIAFESNRSGARRVWMARADGSTPAALTSIFSHEAGAARWSPNGQFVVVETLVGSKPEIDVAPAMVGGSPRLLKVTGRVPSWSSDGAWIYFSSDRTGRYEVWKVSSQGNGNAQQITHSGGWAPVESPRGDTLYYQRDAGRSSGLWRMPANGGAEVLVSPSILERGFAPYGRGVYFLTSSSNGAELRFAEAGGATSTAATLSGQIEGGLSISADGRSALFTKRSASADLMMLDGFR